MGEAGSRVRVERLRKVYGTGRGGRLGGHGTGGTVAVDEVTFSIGPGEIFGLVGGSGAGKSTIARLIMRVIPPTAGRVFVEEKEILSLRARDLRRMRRRIQMVAQDPFQAVHPGMTVRELVAEPLVIHRIGTRASRPDAVARALHDVALVPVDRYLDRYAHNLSGGQLQRVAIARAIVLEPTLLVADEPTSMLDASVQMGILTLLRALRDTKGFSALLITHDLAVARYACDRIAVMRSGRIVEEGDVEAVISAPRHEYTRALLDASEG